MMVENASLFIIIFFETKMLISHVQLHSTSIILSSSSLLYFLVYYNMHRPAFCLALYSCPFLGCKKNCKKPSGLTRHQTTCEFNPKNHFVLTHSSCPGFCLHLHHHHLGLPLKIMLTMEFPLLQAMQRHTGMYG